MPDGHKKSDGRRKAGYPATDYERIFHPRAIAILGVSTEDAFGFGAGMFSAITMMGFEGKIHAVNPKGGTFAGREIYKRVEDIPEPVDFAVIAVNAKHVPAALEACRAIGVAGGRFFRPASVNWERTKARSGKGKSGKLPQKAFALWAPTALAFTVREVD